VVLVSRRRTCSISCDGRRRSPAGIHLFKEKERENILLKDKLVEIETARRKAVKDREQILRRPNTPKRKRSGPIRSGRIWKRNSPRQRQPRKRQGRP